VKKSRITAPLVSLFIVGFCVSPVLAADGLVVTQVTTSSSLLMRMGAESFR
jgi:hypothetical protein